MKFKTKYRIVADYCAGYEVQYRKWWLPFWFQCDRVSGWGTNTNSTIQAAEALAASHRLPNIKVIKYLG